MRQRNVGSVLESKNEENFAGLILETGKVFPRLEVQLSGRRDFSQLLSAGLSSDAPPGLDSRTLADHSAILSALIKNLRPNA